MYIYNNIWTTINILHQVASPHLSLLLSQSFLFWELLGDLFCKCCLTNAALGPSITSAYIFLLYIRTDGIPPLHS